MRFPYYDEHKHEIVLSTGKRFYAFDGILSLDDVGNVSYGSDGSVDDRFTDAERAEIAREQIERWTTWMQPE